MKSKYEIEYIWDLRAVTSKLCDDHVWMVEILSSGF